MLTILEVANLWGMTAADARRYQTHKLTFMQARSDLRYIVVAPDVGTWTEVRQHAIVEHVESPVTPGPDEQRSLVSGRRLRDLVQLHRPDVIECGSPAVLPMLVQLAAARLEPRPALIGFWHGDLARAVVGPRVARVDRRLAAASERATGWWTKQGYAGFDAVFVPSRGEARMLAARGIDRLYLTPLGVDADCFAPERRDPGLVDRLRAGVEARPIVWTDADASTVGPIYAELCRGSAHDPALVLAGSDGEARERLAAARAHVHAPSFASESDRATWLASCDVGLMLGGAVACAEAMATGRAIVASVARGLGERAGELVREAGCGRTVASFDPKALAAATLALAQAADRVEFGRRGRAWIARFDWPSCFERMLVAYAEVLGHVRHETRVPRGVHERLLPAAIQAFEPKAQRANHSS